MTERRYDQLQRVSKECDCDPEDLFAKERGKPADWRTWDRDFIANCLLDQRAPIAWTGRCYHKVAEILADAIQARLCHEASDDIKGADKRPFQCDVCGCGRS